MKEQQLIEHLRKYLKSKGWRVATRRNRRKLYEELDSRVSIMRTADVSSDEPSDEPSTASPDVPSFAV